ncbi:MAG: asparaginase [Vampirovibrionales bacterium]
MDYSPFLNPSNAPKPLALQCRWLFDASLTATLPNPAQPALETFHSGWWVVTNPNGSCVAHSHPAAPTTPTFWRSTAKLLQALPVIEAGLHQQASPAHLAVICASHVGSPLHQSLAQWWLTQAQLTPSALSCGAHPPVDTPTRHALIATHQAPCALHHNCSGKHAGMLAVCQHYGWDIPTYTQPQHPLQQRIMALLTERLGSSVPLAYGMDGCSVPAFYGSLGQLAQLYAVLSHDPLTQPLLKAIVQAPEAFGGAQRLDSLLVQLTHGRLIAKVGAAGVFAVMNQQSHQGLALKLADGHEEARNRVLVTLLGHLNWLWPNEMADPLLWPWTQPTELNAAGKPIGEWIIPTNLT